MIASYYYDPFGRRLWKEVAGVRTYFFYADEGLIGEYDSTGTEIKTYGYKPNSIFTTDPLFIKVSTNYYFYHTDHLGTPQKMTAVNGAVVWSAKYSSFGKATIEVETVENNLRFGGQYYDPETGLHYNYHRYYDPEIGRYLRSDPIGLAGGINQYGYCLNNPNLFIDPKGKNILQFFINIILGLGLSDAENYIKEETEKENENRRRIIEEKISECYDRARKNLKQCDNACLSKHADDDCELRKCQKDCFEEYMPERRFCRELEKRLQKPYPVYY